MIILALDTSTDACSAALAIDNEVFERFQIAPRQHTKLILPMIESLLKETELMIPNLDAIAFGRGPGSFTGVRIASSVVQGLAYAANLPVVPISTLHAIAQGAYEDFGCQNVLVAMDARMNEVYWGEFSLSKYGFMECCNKELVCSPTETAIPQQAKWWGVGSGWKEYENILCPRMESRLQGIKANIYPQARDIAQLAAHAYRQGQSVPAEKALPTYLRNNVIREALA